MPMQYRQQRTSQSLLAAFCFLFFFCCCLVPSVVAVERNNFRTCKESSFCKRQRELVSSDGISPVGDSTPYSLVFNSLHITAQGTLTGDLLHSGTNELLAFELEVWNDATVHFTVNEKNPLKPRYRVPDVVVGTFQPDPKMDYEKTSEFVKFRFGADNDKAVKIQYSPFLLEFHVNDQPALVANARGLLYFEPYRSPEVILEPITEDDGNEIATETAKTEDWSETFRSHRDSRPNGPSSVGLDVSFLGSSHVYGIPEHAADFSLPVTRGSRDTDPYRLFNLDVFEYELNEPMALYGSVPFMMSHKEDLAVGMLWLNAAETWVDVTRPEQGTLARFLGSSMEVRTDTQWMSESGIIEVFIFLGPTPKDVLRQYSKITGPSYLPPYFSIAYHQCRWNYIDEADVERVDRGFDEHDIPYDVLWLDIEHTDNKKYFTWHKDNFPDPPQMQMSLAGKSRKMVTIVDPHIKRDSNYHIHSDATRLDYYVKRPEGGNFDGHCWPGSSSWIDFTNPEARDWWASKFSFSAYAGSTENLYIWNDMNEPSVFSGPETTMPKDLIHYGNWEHREVHNLYGFYQQMSTVKGLVNRSNGSLRPFVLSRAYYSGSQRYGAIWTGDNAADWEHLKASVPMLLSNSMAGIPFAGADVGGFFGNPEPELLVRWYQVGAFQPFFRGHAHIDTKRREPWLFGEPYTSNIRSAIRQRYMLLPYVYTLFHQSSIDLTPPMRPLFFEFPNQASLFDIQDQYMLGDALMVKIIGEQGTTHANVQLPGSSESQIWYHYENFHRVQGSDQITVATSMESIPVFLRGGKILVRKDRVRRSSPLMKNDPFTILFGLDNKNEAEGEIYVDDGSSFDYQKGAFSWKQLHFRDNVLSIVDKDPSTPSKYPTPNVERIVIAGVMQAPKQVVTIKNNNAREVHPHTYDRHHHVLVVKLPNVNFLEDSQVVLEYN